MMDDQKQNSVWMVLELMGHVTIAGNVTKSSEWGGLWQVDIPDGEGYRTEFVSTAAIYKARVVSEEIARAYALKETRVIAYDAPIVTREMHEGAMEKAREEHSRLRRVIDELERRLTAVEDRRELESGEE